MSHDVRPTTGDLTEARAVAEVALDGAERTLPAEPAVENGLRVALGWTDDPTVAADFGGAVATCHAPDRVSVAFTSEPEGWTDAVLAATARGAGRAWLQGGLPDGRVAFRWQAVLADAAGVAVARAVAPETPTPWPDAAQLRPWWPTLRDGLDAPVDAGHPLADDRDDGAEAAPPAAPLRGLGVVLAEALALPALPEATASEVRAALDEVLGEGPTDATGA